MTSMEMAIILRYLYLTLKPKIFKNKNVSIWASLSAAHIDTFQIIQKSSLE